MEGADKVKHIDHIIRQYIAYLPKDFLYYYNLEKLNKFLNKHGQ